MNREEIPLIRSKNLKNPRRPSPGNVYTDKFPIYDIAPVPHWDITRYRFRIFGEVEEEREFSLAELKQFPKVRLIADFHCVTGWSKRELEWGGFLSRVLWEKIRPKNTARFLLVHCLEGYSTNLSLEDFLSEDVLFAYELNGKELPLEHGYPLRLIVPHLYAWKSAKYVCALEFLSEEIPGYWEERGYHMRGDPWKEERTWKEGMTPSLIRWLTRKKRGNR
ncbi:MAG: sulfite oxidase-like oxidoreductase [bacterium JZ-2024 1]